MEIIRTDLNSCAIVIQGKAASITMKRPKRVSNSLNLFFKSCLQGKINS